MKKIIANITKITLSILFTISVQADYKLGKDYRLALLDIASRNLTVLTQNKSDESPFFAPNGGMIIFSTNRDNKGILSIISLHSNQIVELMQQEGEVREPSWSNYSN